MSILIDSSILCAYANSRDVHHQNAMKIIENVIAKKYGSCITTDYIFDETVTVAMRKSDKKIAIEIGNFLLNSEIFIAKIDSLIFQKAWEFFQNTDSLSFTDCTSAAFMQMFGIKVIATFDRGFKQVKNVRIVDSTSN